MNAPMDGAPNAMAGGATNVMPDGATNVMPGGATNAVPDGAMNVVPAGALREAADALGRVPLFGRLPRAALERLAGGATRRRVDAGAIVMKEGEPGDGLYLLLSGELRVARRIGAEELELGMHSPGDFIGELSLLEHAPRSATVRAASPSELLVIAPAAFDALVAAEPYVALLLLRTALERLRSTEATTAAHARLVSLGTLAAGLAHEINNPAAAVRRGLAHLADVVDELGGATLACARLGAAALAAVEKAGTCSNAAPPVVGTPAERAAEDGLAAWLTNMRVPAAGELAPRLLSGGWSPASLESLVDGVPPSEVPLLLRWLGARCAAHALLAEMTASARAITDVVSAVRQHAQAGSTGIRPHSVPDGIHAALVMLRGRIDGAIRVERVFPPSLPVVDSHGGELNQVWLNLLENAIHAVSPAGTIRIVARASRTHVCVDITDDGYGIAPDVLPRIFDPFFTTRAEGSGLGLHVVRTIVRRHHGDVGVTSRPGATTVSVRLPMRLSRDGSRP